MIILQDMKKIFLTILAIGSVVCAQAQMDNVVEVENTYTPTVKDANKINVLPQAETTTVKHYDVEYQTDAKATDDYAFEPAEAAQSDLLAKGEPENFLTLAGGNGGTLLTRGAYGWELSDKNTLHFDLSLRGHNKETEHFADENLKWMQRFYQTKGNVLFEHKLNDLSRWYVRGGVTSSVFNYQPQEVLYYGNHIDGDILPTDKQHTWDAYAETGITPYRFGQFTVDGYLKMRVFKPKSDKLFRETAIYTEYEDGKTLVDYIDNEDTYEGAVNLDYEINDQHSAGVGIKDRLLHYGSSTYKKQNAFEVLPHYAFSNEKVDLRLGARLIFESGLEQKFHVAPDASITVHVTPDVDVFGEARGGLYFNDLFMMNSLAPYWKTPNRQMASQFNQVEANAGVKWHIRDGWFAKFYAGYDVSKNRAELTAPIGQLSRNEVFTADGSLVHIDAHTKYSYKDILNLDAKGRFNGWSIKKRNPYYYESPAWRPVVEASAAASVQPVTGLRIGVDYEFASFTSDENVDYKRPTTHNLGASISYKIPRQLLPLNLSVYCRGDNLLNQKYDAFYGYRTIGTTVLAGVALNF